MKVTRRAALAMGAGFAALAAGAATSYAADLHPAGERTLTRIAFGSCANQDKPQPIWDAINAAKPDLFIFLGDNIYADTRDMNVMRAKYAKQAAQPGFAKLRATTPACAIWDDHDFGENDAGGDYPMKAESQKIFCDFWGEAADSPRRMRDGVYAAYVFGPEGRRVQVILPDLRFNRTPLIEAEYGGKKYTRWAIGQKLKGAPIPGPYLRNPDDAATMLGARQWEWLEAQLAAPADIRIFASSLQVVADFPGWEAWINYAEDHQRLLEAIRRHRANGLFCISGDTHYGEISRLDRNAPYPLWDITSSGFTEVWPVLPPNSRRVGEAYRDNNFGLIDIDWAAQMLNLSICDADGRQRVSQGIALATMRV